uniref:Uncharacterized protein n=1 Tax=viral metagenome TaxID=1070528 RepID=A0A6H1ZLR7_9ZZZZ
MVSWIKENGNYKSILIVVLLGFLGWSAVQIYAMPDKFIQTERYLTDQARIEVRLNNIQKDIKEVLRVLK